MTEPFRVGFGKHLPDQPAFNNPGTPYLKNVIPSDGFLRPFSDLDAYSDALTARCQGAISGRDTSGNVYNFAGDATKLYKLSSNSFTDVTRLSGGAYATPSTGGWEFIRWSDDYLIAINGVDDPQTIDPQTGVNFTALAGSPPAARHGAVVRSFIFLGNWTNNENVVQWSALDNPEEYNTDGTNQSDQQAIPSGGAILRIFGGEVATVFCQSSIHRFTYLGGDVIFDRAETGPGVGLLASGGAAQFGNLIFFVGQNSFYKMAADGVPVPIGESRFNKTFFADLNDNHIDKISSAIDPINTIWIVAYPSVNSPAGLPDKLFLYNWATNDCSFVTIDTEFILGAYTPGTTLDDLTTSTGYSLDALPFSLDSRVWQGGALVFAGFNQSHMMGFFSGSNLEAIIETSERDLIGQRIFIDGVRPLADASDAQVAIGTRETQAETVSFGSYSSVEADGLCPQFVSTRFARARLKIPAGSVWSRTQGVDVYGEADGEI